MNQQRLEVFLNAFDEMSQASGFSSVMRVIVETAVRLTGAQDGCWGELASGKKMSRESYRPGAGWQQVTDRAAPPEPDARVLVFDVSAGEGAQGFFELRLEAGAMDPEDESLLSRLSACASTAVRNARAVGELKTELTRRQKSEDELKVATRRFREMFEQSPSALQIFTPDGTCVQANEAWERFWETSRAELVGYNILKDRNAVGLGVLHLIEKAFAGEAVRLPERLYDPALNGKPGRPRWISTYLFPLKNEDGKVREVVVSLDDITERKEAEGALDLSLQRFKLAEKAARIGSYEWDIARGTANWTSQLEVLHGREASGGLDGTFDTWSKHVHPEDAAIAHARLLEAARGNGDFSTEYRVNLPDGSVRWILSLGKVYPDRQGNPGRVIGVVLDITARKESEQALQEAIRARDEFLSVASHELKTPLTSMMIQLEMARMAIEEGDPEARSAGSVLARLDGYEKQIDRLTRQVEEMLDISRITSGTFPIHRTRCELNSLVRDVMTQFKSQLPTPGRAVLLESPEPILGSWDCDRVGQLFTNLLINALKYGESKPIEVRVSREGDRAILTVRDQGPGIAPENHERIFMKFERAVSDRNISGLGLGLFICRQIAEAHGGSIRVESRVGAGATFRVELPLEAGKAAADAG